jgi:hypothetical protein
MFEYLIHKVNRTEFILHDIYGVLVSLYSQNIRLLTLITFKLVEASSQIKSRMYNTFA